MVGPAIGSGVLRALAGLKIGLLAFLATWGFASGRGDWSNLTPFWTQRPGSHPLPEAPGRRPDPGVHLVRGLVGCQQDRGRGPRPRSAPCRAPWCWACRSSRSCISRSAWSFLYLVARTRIDSRTGPRRRSRPWPAARSSDGPGEVVFSAIVVVSVAGSLAAVLMASPRVYYAMARDGLFFPGFAAVDPRRGTPVRAIAIQAALATLLALTGSFDQILGYFMVPTLAFLAMARRLGSSSSAADRGRERPRPPSSIPGYPVTVLLFLVPDPDRHRAADRARSPCGPRSGWAVVAVGLPVSDRRSSTTGADAGQFESLTRSRYSSTDLEPEVGFPWPGFVRRPWKAKTTRCRRRWPTSAISTRTNTPSPCRSSTRACLGIVASHTLIPQAMYHAFATFGALMSPDLPLGRRQHEMIATMVSLTNKCHY